MIVSYNKEMGYPIEISDNGRAVCISLNAAKKLQANLTAVIEQAESDMEMTEFEEVLAEYMDVSGFASAGNTRNFAKKYGQELLSLARKQLIKDGYVIEKKAFHDAVEKVDPEVMKEVSENIDLENFISSLGERYPEVSFAKLTRIVKTAYDFGNAETLKGLPRWRIELGEMELEAYGIIGGGVASQENPRVYLNGRSIDLYSLKKLPGFKED